MDASKLAESSIQKFEIRRTECGAEALCMLSLRPGNMQCCKGQCTPWCLSPSVWEKHKKAADAVLSAT